MWMEKRRLPGPLQPDWVQTLFLPQTGLGPPSTRRSLCIGIDCTQKYEYRVFVSEPVPHTFIRCCEFNPLLPEQCRLSRRPDAGLRSRLNFRAEHTLRLLLPIPGTERSRGKPRVRDSYSFSAENTAGTLRSSVRSSATLQFMTKLRRLSSSSI